MRPIGGIGGGFLADHFGRAKVLAFVMIIAAIGLFSIVLMSGNTTGALV